MKFTCCLLLLFSTIAPFVTAQCTPNDVFQGTSDLAVCQQDNNCDTNLPACQQGNVLANVEDAFCPVINCCEACVEETRKVIECSVRPLCDAAPLAGCDLVCDPAEYPFAQTGSGGGTTPEPPSSPSPTASPMATGGSQNTESPTTGDSSGGPGECNVVFLLAEVSECQSTNEMTCGECGMLTDVAIDGQGGMIDIEANFCPKFECCTECADVLKELVQCAYAGVCIFPLPNVSGCDLECDMAPSPPLSMTLAPTASPGGIQDNSPTTSPVESQGTTPSPTTLDCDSEIDDFSACIGTNFLDCGGCGLSLAVFNIDPTLTSEQSVRQALCPAINCCPVCSQVTQALYQCSLDPLFEDFDTTCEGVPPVGGTPGGSDNDDPCDSQGKAFTGCILAQGLASDCVTCYANEIGENEDFDPATVSCGELETSYNAINNCCSECESQLNSLITCEFEVGEAKDRSSCPFVQNLGSDSVVFAQTPAFLAIALAATMLVIGY